MADYEDVKVNDLVINNISQEKYDELKTAGQLDSTQIYLTPTEEGGDCLPLSGGTMAGDIFMPASSAHSTYNIKFADTSRPDDSNDYYYKLGRDAAGSDIGFGIWVNQKNNIARYFFTLTSFCALPHTNGVKLNLGNTAKPWKTIYVAAMNNGADLAVPTTGGTLARIEDIDAAVGDISTALTAILGE